MVNQKLTQKTRYDLLQFCLQDRSRLVLPGLPGHLLLPVPPDSLSKLVELLLSLLFILASIVTLVLFLRKYHLARPYWLGSIQVLLMLSLSCTVCSTQLMCVFVSTTLATGSMPLRISSTASITCFWGAISATTTCSSTRVVKKRT